MLHFGAATGFAQTISYFPRVLATSDTATGLALSNPSADPASVTLTFVDSTGAAVGSPAVVSVASGGQIARLSTELFPGSQGQRGWVRMSSTVQGVAGFYLNGDFVTTTDGGEFAPAARAITFPWIVQNATTSTEVTLTNPAESTAFVSLTLFGADGRIVRNVSQNVAARTQLIGTTESLFGVSTLDLGYLRAESTDIVIGAEIVREGTKDFAMLNARADAPARTLVFPHIATGGGYSTALFVQNTGSATQDVTLQFFLDSGASGAADVTVSLTPGQLLRRTVQEAFGLTNPALQTGWVRVTANADTLEGFQVFLAIEPGGITALPAQKTASARLLQSHIAEQTSAVFRSTDLFTGLAILNPNTTAAEAAVTIVTREAGVLSESTQSLRPGEKRALLLREMMPEVLGETSGAVWIRSNAPVFGLQVFGTWNLGLLSQIPAQSTEAILRPATPTANRFAVSGRISSSTGAALGGARIDAIGPVSAFATTDYSGAFVVKNLPAGDYVVTPSRSDLAFTPVTASRTVAANVRGLAFSSAPGTSSPPAGGGGTTPPAGGLTVTPEEVEVRITSPIAVGAYQVTISFSSSVVSIATTGVTGGAAPFNNPPQVINTNTPGEVTFADFQVSSAAPAGTFVAARLRFTGRAAGSSSLTVTQSSVSSADGTTIPSATVSLSATSVTVR